jgi:hypothetical protein
MMRKRRAKLLLCPPETPLYGTRGNVVGRVTARQIGSSRVRIPKVSLEFFIDIILQATLWSLGLLSL